jgi:uncharacterized protein
MKKLSALLLMFLCALLIALPVRASSVNSPNGDYVRDLAGVLSAEAKEYINRNAKALDDATGVQIVLVTFETFKPAVFEAFVNTTYSAWRGRGVMILNSTGVNSSCCIDTIGLANSLPNGEFDALWDDYLGPDLANGDYSSAYVGFFDALSERVLGLYGAKPTATAKTARAANDAVQSAVAKAVIAVKAAYASAFASEDTAADSINGAKTTAGANQPAVVVTPAADTNRASAQSRLPLQSTRRHQPVSGAQAAATALPKQTATRSEVVQPTGDYVSDFAGILSIEAKEHINRNAKVLDDATGAQIVFVTVETTKPTPIDDYAYKLFNTWKIGDAAKNNGLLVLLAIGDDNYYTMEGTGLERNLPTEELSALWNEYLEPDFASKDYSSGSVKYFDALFERVSDIYEAGLKVDWVYSGLDAQTRRPAARATVRPRASESYSYEVDDTMIWLGLLLVFLIVIGIYQMKNGWIGLNGGGSSRTRDDDDDDDSGGGWSGGSSSSSSGSGSYTSRSSSSSSSSSGSSGGFSGGGGSTRGAGGGRGR